MKKRVLIVAGWLAVWQLIAVIVHNNIMIVGPMEVVRSLGISVQSSQFWQSLGWSFMRITTGFLLGVVLGTGLAFGAKDHALLKEILAPFVTALKAVPVASFVILLLIWFGSKNLSLFISFLVVFPIIYLNVLQGLESVDVKMLELAKVYRIPLTSKLRYIYLPQLYPFLVSALQLGIGLSWKSGVAAEVIGQPLSSVGNSLYQSKIYLDTAELFAWTFVIIVVSWGMEKLVLHLLKLVGKKVIHAGN